MLVLPTRRRRSQRSSGTASVCSRRRSSAPRCNTSIWCSRSSRAPIQPNVDPFFAPTQVYDVNLDPSIVAEFAHAVYRFGHSMLTETVDRFDPDFNVSMRPSAPDPAISTRTDCAFLNPLAFAASGPTPEEATGAIVRGMTRQTGNEIDEFVTEALRNNLLGLPLDLPRSISRAAATPAFRR